MRVSKCEIGYLPSFSFVFSLLLDPLPPSPLPPLLPCCNTTNGLLHAPWVTSTSDRASKSVLNVESGALPLLEERNNGGWWKVVEKGKEGR